MINIPIEEFKEKWYKIDEDLYTNGYLTGIIIVETDEYIIIKLKD